jgi:hypothetical protein
LTARFDQKAAEVLSPLTGLGGSWVMCSRGFTPGY